MTENKIKLIESYKQITQTIKTLSIQLDTYIKINAFVKISKIEEKLKELKEQKELLEKVLDGCVDGWRDYL